MAEQAVSTVVEKLSNLLVEEVILQHGVRDQVKWLERELRRMQCFLKDADSKQKEDERVRNWVRDIRDVAHQAEDIIDTFVLEIGMQPLETEIQPPRRRKRTRIIDFIKRLAHLPHVPSKLIVRHSIGMDINEIKKKIVEISNSRAMYGINDLGESGGKGPSPTEEYLQARRRISPHLDDTVVVGFEHDKVKLLQQLLDQGTKRRCVISIVGMGGLGKTTLANKIYNSTEVRRSFVTRCWVSVSNDCQITELLKDLTVKFMRVSREELKDKSEDEMKEKLHNFLTTRRYLVLLDDVWTKEVWDRIKSAFPDAMNESRVMITTRSLDVARSADPISDPHNLRCLNPEESWELFLKTVFLNNDIKTCCPMELVDLGHQLAHKCGGLPLALVVLGGFLSIKRKTTDVWLRVAKSMNWQSIQDGEQCLKIIGLSYNDLPYHLKSCFLYLAAFPEDSKICASRLIKLWTAEGFLPDREGPETTEETAEACLEELAQRCMVQVVRRRKSFGGIKEIRIHDLLRDLAISEAREDGFLTVCNSAQRTNMKMARRLALHCIAPNCSNPNLRTLLGFIRTLGQQEAKVIFVGFKLLRVMDLEGANLGETCLPEEIKSLIHLRYLGLRHTELTQVPSSIGNLCNLQTLDVRRTDLRSLPVSFWKIQTLRHVLLNTNIPIPSTIASLNHLQTLEGAQAGEWIEHCLARLTNLRKLGVADASSSNVRMVPKIVTRDHSFRISQLNVVSDVISIFPNNPNLHVVELWGPLANKQLPNCRDFPSYLTKLILQWSSLEEDPMPTLEKLPYLKILGLWKEAYVGKEMVCSAGGFLLLQQLWLVDLYKIWHWRVENGALPSLSFLCIHKCPNMQWDSTALQHATVYRKFNVMPEEIKDKIQTSSSIC